MTDEDLYLLLLGVNPEVADTDRHTLRAALDDLPKFQETAYFGTDELVSFAVLDESHRALFLIEFARGSERVSIRRWSIPTTVNITTEVGPRRSGMFGPLRDRLWRIDFGGGREIEFESVEQSRDESQSRVSRNETFARALVRLVGWDIPD